MQQRWIKRRVIKNENAYICSYIYLFSIGHSFQKMEDYLHPLPLFFILPLSLPPLCPFLYTSIPSTLPYSFSTFLPSSFSLLPSIALYLLPSFPLSFHLCLFLSILPFSFSVPSLLVNFTGITEKYF